MTWGEKFDKIIKRNQDIGVKEFIASKTSPTCVLVQYRDDRYRCTFCGNVVIGDSRYCPSCGAWNKTYDSKFYDLYDDDDDVDEDYEDDDCEEEDE